jgi:U2 small nuclear ribonucleoprotein A'
MRLTADVIERSAQYTNLATSDRELNLRSLKITEIENLGATLDQFDCIDLTDNDIRRLDNFPLLSRLKRLLLSNNRVQRIADDLHEQLPALEGLVLINNELAKPGDLDPLAACIELRDLSLLNNPLTIHPHYRLYTIHRLPQLRTLDFRRIKKAERDAARQLFKGKKGKALEKELTERSRVTSNANNANGVKNVARPHSAEEVSAIKAAIDKANSLEEIERLNNLLRQGVVPSHPNVHQSDAFDSEQMDE